MCGMTKDEIYKLRVSIVEGRADRFDMLNALDLIESQRAEIERLTKERDEARIAGIKEGFRITREHACAERVGWTYAYVENQSDDPVSVYVDTSPAIDWDNAVDALKERIAELRAGAEKEKGQ
jgi:hypothetical protein